MIGYWRKPDLTEARFLPVAGDARARLYRTGDLGRLRLDGLLEHLGRKDRQVKVRGLRIELEEVEAALLRLGAVRETAVVAEQDPGGEKRLAAYVVPRPGLDGSIAALRAELARTLPDYMVPSTFVTLEALPLTPTGKVDRQALGGLRAAGPKSGETGPPPRLT